MGKFFESLGFNSVEPDFIASIIYSWNHVSIGDDGRLTSSAFWCEHKLIKLIYAHRNAMCIHESGEAKIEYNGNVFVAQYHGWRMTVSIREKKYVTAEKYKIEYNELKELPSEFADLVLGIFLFAKHKIKFIKPQKIFQCYQSIWILM